MNNEERSKAMANRLKNGHAPPVRELVRTTKAERAQKARKKWEKRDAMRGGRTIFAHFSRDKGKEWLTVGYGDSPGTLAGGHGVPVGVGFEDSLQPSRSYLVLCFPNEYTGPELAQYLGGVSKRLRNHGKDFDAEYLYAMVSGALERARK